MLMMSGKAKKIIVAAVIADVFFWAWFAGFVWFSIIINGYGIQENVKTEAVVVLTGGKNRVSEAVKILNNNLADKLFISGVSNKVSINNIENTIGAKILYPERTYLGYKAKNTIQNAEEVADWLQRNHITSVRLVTSNYHIPRSIAELSAYKLPLTVIPHPVYSDKIAKDWWKSWATFKFIANEYNKYLVVCLRNFFNFRR
ncbi:MAG: YdcF family protein [Alphaproteobacteria bacterium]|nr:YdcF family protein [Alphaproteobacteria bacterium]